MPRIAYVDHRFVPHDRACVHVEDRGFQFADSVYEVVTVIGGRPIDAPGHLDRLARSLAELRIALPMGRPALTLLLRELVRRNRIGDGIVYIQVSRGRAPRDFRFPDPSPPPTLVMTARAMALPAAHGPVQGIAVVTVPDIRWQRRDIKTTGLLAQVLAKQAAFEAGAKEAWMVEVDGTVTEASSANAWIVTAEGVLVTRPATHAILKGVTRSALMQLCAERQMRVEERAFTVAEALAAREAFVSSATTIALPVTSIDGRPIGDGEPGPIAALLREAYLAYAADPSRAFAWTA